MSKSLSRQSKALDKYVSKAPNILPLSTDLFQFSNIKTGEMDLKVEGPWNTEKYCRPPWLADKKYSRLSRIAKTVTFLPW